MAKKRKGRIRQTRTSFQKVFDSNPEIIQSFSWIARLPEFIHISITLINNDYETIEKDFFEISEFINSKFHFKQKFHFNLTHTLQLIIQDKTVLDKINSTVFKESFESLLYFYNDLFDISIVVKSYQKNLIFIGYRQILDGRSETSILGKYLMLKYSQIGNFDPTNLFNLQNKEQILDPINVSRIMSLFPIMIGQSENFDLDLCEDIWLYNYINSPLLPSEDSKLMEEEHFLEMNINELKSEFNSLYSKVKELNLLAIYPKFIAEINMGFIARICNLCIDTIDLIKIHKAELAEIVFRSNLETFIVASWLVKKQDINLHSRFREFSTGREKFFGEDLINRTDNVEVQNEAKRMIENAIKEAGTREENVASERGDIFEISIAQMSEDVWGQNNLYYALYKRMSEVTHGHWSIIAKYHLSKSNNPLHNGLYWYNDTDNRYSGLVPVFSSLNFAVDFLIRILNDIDAEETHSLITAIKKFKSKVSAQYKVYFEKYIKSEEVV